MKSVVIGVLLAALLAVVAWYASGQFGTSAADRFTTPTGAVRLD